jgi:hypothetical protein
MLSKYSLTVFFVTYQRAHQARVFTVHTRPERLARNKQYSLLGTFVSLKKMSVCESGLWFGATPIVQKSYSQVTICQKYMGHGIFTEGKGSVRLTSLY